jgi:hypothetical protein
MADLPVVRRNCPVRHFVLHAICGVAIDYHWCIPDYDECLAVVLGATFTCFVIARLLGQFGVLAVFIFVAGAIGMVAVVSAALFGPSTNNSALEEISH